MLNFPEIKKKQEKKHLVKLRAKEVPLFWWMQKPISLEETMYLLTLSIVQSGQYTFWTQTQTQIQIQRVQKKYRCSDRINACLLKETTVSVLQCKSALKLYALTSKCGLMYVWGCMLFCAIHTHKKNHNIHGDSPNLYALSQHIYHFVSTWWQYKPKTALWCVCMYVFAGMLTCCSIYFLAILQCITTYTRLCIN